MVLPAIPSAGASPFAQTSSLYNSNASLEASALDSEAFVDPSAASIAVSRQRCLASFDTLIPNTSAFIKPHTSLESPCLRGFTQTSTALDMGDSSANSANPCTNTAPIINMMKKQELSAHRNGFPVGRIQNIFSRRVSFCKRRNRLFKKAYELSGLCDAEVAAIVFSPSGKLSEFASSSLSRIIKRYQSVQPQMLSNDLLLQDVERWKCEAILLDARLKHLQELPRCVLEKNSTTLSINEIQNIESRLEYSLDKIQKRKMELLEVESHTIRTKGEILFRENNFLKGKVGYVTVH